MPFDTADAAQQVYSAFSRKDVRALRKINDKCIESIGAEFSEGMYLLAQISYILVKILVKPRYWRKEGASTMRALDSSLKSCASVAKARNEAQTAVCLRKSLQLIGSLDAKDRRFITTLGEKAKLKIASTLYAQGFSLGIASEITGVDQREIMSYAGGTMMFDRLKSEVTMGERLRRARKIFES